MERELTDSEIQAVSRYLQERPNESESAREGTGYLCGITSSKTSRVKGSLYGALEMTPFVSVMHRLEG